MGHNIMIENSGSNVINVKNGIIFNVKKKKGTYENIEELSLNTNFKYICPFYRKDHESIMRQKHKNEKIKKNSLLNIKRKSNSNDHNEINKICNKK